MEQVFVCTAPGRTEIGGNHTDHQHGCVLAAAVNLETRAELRRDAAGREAFLRFVEYVNGEAKV